MKDRVYPAVVLGFRALFGSLGIRFRIEGSENMPAQGGAVLASNHISYLDFAFLGFAIHRVRLVRFMCKASIFNDRIAGPLMRGMHHIPVDRGAGGQAFRDALTMLKQGEVVGVFPEATISRSFELKEFKSGAVRMAQAAGVPLVPAIVWGTQRMWTKGRPKDLWGRRRAITVLYGEPLTPGRRDDPLVVEVELRRRMQALLEKARADFPDRPADDADRWWLPAALGGTAPTLAEAEAMDAAESARRQGEGPA